jgi:hypothetical protein
MRGMVRLPALRGEGGRRYRRWVRARPPADPPAGPSSGPGRLSRRGFLAAGAASLGAAAAGAVLGARGEAPGGAARRWPEVYRERFGAGPPEDRDAWFRPFHTRRWDYLGDRAVYHVPLTNDGPFRYLPEPIWKLDRNVRDADHHVVLALSDPTMGAGPMLRGDAVARAYAATVEASGRLVLARTEPLHRVSLAEAETNIDPVRPFHVRLEAFGGRPVRLRARAWQDGGVEPETWPAEAIDDSPVRLDGSGAFGIVVLPPAPGRHGALTILSSIGRSEEFHSGTPSGLAFALAGPPVPDEGGTYRVRIRVRTGLPARPAVEVGLDPSLGRSEEVRSASNDHSTSGEVELRGLPPDAAVSWRARARRARGGPETVGPIQRLRTPPGPGRAVRFAFGSCTFPAPPHASFETMARLEPDFFVHLGDLGYAHSHRNAAATATPDAYEDRWTRLLAQRTFRRLQGVAPVVLAADDHDLGRNNCWAGTCLPWPQAAFATIHANPDRSFCSFRWGDVEVFLLDVRRSSDDPALPDGASKSRLGGEQKRWLLRGMAVSDARLLVVASPSPLRTRVIEDPSWEEAFAHEREELLASFLERPQRVVIVSGDAHGTRVMRYRDRGGSGRVVHDHLCAGTEQHEDIGVRVDIHDPDRVTDPDRFIPGRHNTFGFVAVDRERVTMRSLASETGADLFPPLDLPLAW